MPRKADGSEKEIVRLYAGGSTLDELAERFDTSRTPIRRILIESGVELRRAGQLSPAGPADADALRTAYEAGATALSLARDYGCDVKTMRRWLVAAGVTIDSRRRRSR